MSIPLFATLFTSKYHHAVAKGYIYLCIHPNRAGPHTPSTSRSRQPPTHLHRHRTWLLRPAASARRPLPSRSPSLPASIPWSRAILRQPPARSSSHRAELELAGRPSLRCGLGPALRLQPLAAAPSSVLLKPESRLTSLARIQARSSSSARWRCTDVVHQRYLLRPSFSPLRRPQGKGPPGTRTSTTDRAGSSNMPELDKFSLGCSCMYARLML
jgi:hypothetical protein